MSRRIARSHLAFKVFPACLILLCSYASSNAFDQVSDVSLSGAHPPEADADCVTCHGSYGRSSGGVFPLNLPPEADLDHWWFGCNHCHSTHGGTNNLHLIRAMIDTDYLPPNYVVKDGLRTVNFIRYEGSNSFADGDLTYDGVCEVCHTDTAYHRNDPSGDHLHQTGLNCSNCHDHGNWFQPTGVANHPQAVTDCANCHLNPSTGEQDLLFVHGSNCTWCHTAGFGGTFLGPSGTWQHECTECHNPGIAETGNLETPTKGHRCVLCHGEQRQTGDSRDIHDRHIEAANCVVCHGFTPDAAFEIGSGNRDGCTLCHSPGQHVGTPQHQIHHRHVPKGANCIECHDGVRPAVDVVDGPPVGSSSNVCEICHANESPGDFLDDIERRHEDHTAERIDCGACHADANLQDDRDPMPPIDDPVRAALDRQGNNECVHCHEGGESGSSDAVHRKHVADQWQWCFNCHEPTDLRPSGQVPPVEAPDESCILCHTDEVYTNTYPYNVHRRHADKAKCYSCHQLDPRLFDWPAAWATPAPALPRWFGDLDTDTHGNRVVTHVSIDPPVGFVANTSDCDDGSGVTYPGGAQICDGLNNDCNDPAWPNLRGTNEADDDGDTVSECLGDCNDSTPLVYSGAPEVNDGKDNQCPGDSGFGLVDEISGRLELSMPISGAMIFWPAQTGAIEYEIGRSGDPTFAAACSMFSTTATAISDPETPAPGATFHYLVRAAMPNPGSWGPGAATAERLVPCVGPPG